MKPTARGKRRASMQYCARRRNPKEISRINGLFRVDESVRHACEPTLRVFPSKFTGRFASRRLIIVACESQTESDTMATRAGSTDLSMRSAQVKTDKACNTRERNSTHARARLRAIRRRERARFFSLGTCRVYTNAMRNACQTYV